MAQTPDTPNAAGQRQSARDDHPNELLYCPSCARKVGDPLTCGDCLAVICRVCGTPLESADDLAVG